MWVDMSTAETIGTEQQKDRPYVIVSRNSVNDIGENVVGVPLSTKVHKACQHRIQIPPSEIIKDSGYTRPIPAMVALTDHIRVLDPTRLVRRMGRLSDSAIISVGLGLTFLFVLDE